MCNAKYMVLQLITVNLYLCKAVLWRDKLVIFISVSTVKLSDLLFQACMCCTNIYIVMLQHGLRLLMTTMVV
jgi:hypothetical protein